MENIMIKYTSFASAPKGIIPTKAYSFGKDSKGYFYEDNNKKIYAELNYIKMLFSPIDSTWKLVCREESKKGHK